MKTSASQIYMLYILICISLEVAVGFLEYIYAYNISASMQNSIVKMIQAEKVVFYIRNNDELYYWHIREKTGLEIDFLCTFDFV